MLFVSGGMKNSFKPFDSFDKNENWNEKNPINQQGFVLNLLTMTAEYKIRCLL